jgi:hypothetical protein
MENPEVEREVEVRGNGSQLFTETYSEAAIARLKNLVLTFFAQDERKYYSISLDGEIVVARNCDGRKFDRYLQFLNKHTQMVEVKMYQGFSPNCNRYQFILNRGLAGTPNAVDVQSQINKALEEQRLQNELDALRTELALKKKKLKKFKKLNENSESGLDKLKELVKGGVELAGALGLGAQKGLSGAPEPEAEVEIEPADSSDTKSDSSTSKSQQVFDDLLETYGEEGVKNALGWMTVLAANPDLVNKLKEELKNQKKSENGKA